MFPIHLQRETVALILGGGRGSRLFPLTRERSKPAVPLGGKFRFIDIALSNSINSGLRQIFVLTQYNSASLNNHVVRTYKFDAFTSSFVAILAAEQRLNAEKGWYQGTADAVRQSLRYLRDPSFKNVLIIPGDHLCRINFGHLLEMHEAQNAEVTFSAAVVNQEDASRFRILKLNNENQVRDLARKTRDEKILARFSLTEEEKAQHNITWDAARGPAYLAFMGVYLFKKEVLQSLLEQALDDQDLAHDTLPRILWQHRSFCYVFTGYWRDIGTIRTFYDASIAITQEDAPFRFQDGEAPIYTHARFLPSARIYRSTLDSALVADGAEIIQSSVEQSVVGVRAKIHANTQISRSIIFGADTFEGEGRRASALKGDGLPSLGIGPGSVIKGAIIDKNARIGAGCHLENVLGTTHADGPGYYIRDGIIIIPKSEILEPGTIIRG